MFLCPQASCSFDSLAKIFSKTVVHLCSDDSTGQSHVHQRPEERELSVTQRLCADYKTLAIPCSLIKSQSLRRESRLQLPEISLLEKSNEKVK